jgi:hypothetical protein
MAWDRIIPSYHILNNPNKTTFDDNSISFLSINPNMA